MEHEGRSGGLALFNMDSYDVSILYFYNRMIDISATIEGHKVFMTFVYGDPVVECRDYVWERLTRMSSSRTGAWLMSGDFNEITGNHEKRGGRKRPETCFLAFKSMLADCGMIEFPYKGNPMSWMGYRRSGKVQCRLDRTIGNKDWNHIFSHTNVEYLKLWGSDHRPVLTRIQSRSVRLWRSFKFDRRWLDKNGLKEAIKEGWGPEETNGNRTLHINLCDVRRAISRWKKLNPSNTQKKIETIKEQLEKAHTDDSVMSEELLNLKWNLCTAFREEELYWRQKSRALWLKYGDRNTKFFHAISKQRRARNRITKLKKPGGGWAESKENIEKVAFEYFQNLFTASETGDFEEALRFISVKVTPTMNETLT